MLFGLFSCTRRCYSRIFCKVPCKTQEPVTAKSVISVFRNKITARIPCEPNILIENVKDRKPDLSRITLPELFSQPGIPFNHVIVIREDGSLFPQTDLSIRVELQLPW
jgi:hypothetical protein